MSGTGAPDAGHVDPRVARSRQAILSAGVELLIEGGPNAVTMDAVVAASGVAKTTIYRHWSSRDELLLDVFRTLCPDVTAPDPSLSFVDAMRETLSIGTDTMRDPNWRRAMPSLMMLKDHDPHFTTIHAELEAQEVEVLGGVLQRGIDEGLVRPSVTIDEFFHIILGPLVYATLADREVTADVIDAIIRRFLASEAYLMTHEDPLDRLPAASASN